MTKPDFHQNDKGVILKFQFVDEKQNPVPLRGNAVVVRLLYPDLSTVGEIVANVENVLDAERGISRYTTTGVDFPQSGEYIVQSIFDEAGNNIAAVKKSLTVGKRLFKN